MGFGYGNAKARDDGSPVRKAFDNSMTAHVWAQGSQSFGQSSNGNLFFHGPALFSYGSHYVAGLLLPDLTDPSRIARALLNADSYSVSTSRHVSDAARAVRHLSPLHVPALTDLATLFESGFSVAARRVKIPGPAYTSDMGGGNEYHDAAGWPRAINRKALAAHMAPRLKAFFSDPDHAPLGDGTPESTVAAIFAAAGCDAPERRARAALKVAAKAEDKRKADRAKAKKEAALRTLEEAALTSPARVAARMVQEARERPAGYESTRATWEKKARELFRAIKAGKAAGRSGQVRKAQEVRRVIRATLPEFEKAAVRNARASHWKSESAKFKAGAVALQADDSTFGGDVATYRGDGGPNRNGPGERAARLEKAATAGRYLASYLGAADVAQTDNGRGMACKAARIMGHNPADVAARVMGHVATLDAAADKANAAARRAGRRAEVAKLKAARDMAPDAPAAARLAALKTAESVAGKYAPRVAYSWQRDATAADLAPYYKAPGAWAVSGWTPARFGAVRDVLKAGIADLVAKAEEEKRAAALTLWRAGEPVPRDLARFAPRSLPDGSAYVRARGVERDDAGAITGGTLETSQGAAVPLTHAVRVFRFLKACRERGQGWQANGRVVRVGHFHIDHVTADGGFKAGCHVFIWEEVARVAADLGLTDIAPAADLPEPRKVTA